MPQANAFSCYPDFFIRTPAFSLDNLKDIPAESKDLLTFLSRQWENPIIKGAIILASPALYNQLNSELESPDPPQKLLLSFLRYYIRMCFRCTPFGLFAGVGTGVISNKTEIKICNQSLHSLKCRMDMEFLGNLVMKFSRDPEI